MMRKLQCCVFLYSASE